MPTAANLETTYALVRAVSEIPGLMLIAAGVVEFLPRPIPAQTASAEASRDYFSPRAGVQ